MATVEFYDQKIEELKNSKASGAPVRGSQFPDLGLARQADIEYYDPGYTIRKAKAAAFIDDDSMLEFLASERFPNDPSAAMRYSVVNGQVVYEDIDGQIKPEFRRPSDVTAIDEYVIPNIIPATTLVADMTGGMVGAKKGFEFGVNSARKLPPPLSKNPFVISAMVLGSTMAGGFGGNMLIGGIPRTARAVAIDQFYNLPPEEIAASLEDLGYSSIFSAIPFGAGPTRNIVEKFTGKQDTLKQLLALRGSVQETLDTAARNGIELTVAEAGDIAGTMGAQTLVARQLQHFLSQQPQVQKLRTLYNNRSQRVSEAITVFADSISSGSSQFKDANRRVAEAANKAMKELIFRRKTRASKLYESMRRGNLPDGVEPTQVDLSPVIARLDEIISNTRRDEVEIEAAKAFKRTLMEVRTETVPILDKNGIPKLGNDGEALMKEVEVQVPLTDLMDIHDRRTLGMEKIVRSALNETGSGLQRLVIGLREDVTELLDKADGTYAFARRVYDPEKANLAVTESSAIGRLSNFFGKGNDKTVARSIKEIFDPNASVQSLRNARRVLQAVDPKAWQDTKQYFLNEQLDNFTKAHMLEGGVPNFQRHFSQPKYQRMMEELLEPDEFENFSNMMGLMDRAFNAVPRGGSQTQSAAAFEDILAKEAGGGAKDTALKVALIGLRSGGRLLSGQIGDSMLQRIAMKQQEAYYNALTDVLLNSPDAAKSVENAYNYIDLVKYSYRQAGARGVGEVEEMITTPGVKEYEPTESSEKKILEKIESLEQNNQSSVDLPSDESIFEPIKSGPTIKPPFDPAMSPTIVPSEKDRELAMRTRGNLGGIASLA